MSTIGFIEVMHLELELELDLAIMMIKDGHMFRRS